MRLIKMARVEEITGLHKVSIATKVKNKKFPKQHSGSQGTMEPYLWDEKEVVNWLVKLETEVLGYNRQKHAASTIAKIVNTTKPVIVAILAKHGVSENIAERASRDFFHLVLKTSAQLNNNRGM